MSGLNELARDYFQVGDHVLLTTDEDGVVGGYLCDLPQEEGVLLQVTHVMQPQDLKLTDALAADIAASVAATPEWKQKLILALAGRLDALTKKGIALQKASAQNVVRQLQEEHEKGNVQALVEMDVPVLTMYSFGTYTKMRLTSDHNVMVSVGSLDDEFKNMQDNEREKDEDGSV